MKSEIVTFGCRLNIYESEVIRKITDDSNSIIFNTCSVTKEAERKARQAVRSARKKNPNKKIIVTGCSAQLNPKQWADMPEVDLVIGNEEKLIKDNYNLDIDSKIKVDDIMSVKETASHLISSFDGITRAFVQIQNGCNHRCTFCIIPFARGNNRSNTVAEIVNQIRALIDSGYKEIVLTGVDISDYGLDLPGKPSLANLIKRILILVPDLIRLRLSSIDVAEIDEELFDLIAYEKRIMPHIHISAQSGDNMILKRMKRRHNRDMIIEFCNNIRKIRSDIAFGADLIAGFPTENEYMFLNTLNLIKDASIQFLHIFPYSKHDQTPSARMPQVEKKIITERAKILREEGRKELNLFLKKQIGKKTSIMIESKNTARTENFLTANLNHNLPYGTISNAMITDIEKEQLIAKII